MRLFEAIIEANHRALAGDQNAGLHPADFLNELPVVALTCIDARLNQLFPQVLGVPPDQFIWLRNAGNIVTGSLSSTMRSLTLACAVKGGKEIAIIGHTDCMVGKTNTLQLLERLRAMGVERHLLPANVNEYFGIFSSERQNVIKSAEFVRNSPLLGPKIPVHGLMVDTDTGKLDWIVNGYETAPSKSSQWNEIVQSASQTIDALRPLSDFQIGEIKFPETKIGEFVTQTEDWLKEKIQQAEVKPSPPPVTPPLPPRIPVPPPLRPKLVVRKGPKLG